MAKLPKPRFNLKAPKSKTETLIFLVFRYRGKRLLYSTSFTILPRDWDFKTQRPIDQERRPDLWEIRNRLEDILSFCKSIYIESDYGCISIKAFKNQLDLKTNRVVLEQEKPKPSFIEFLDLELDSMKVEGMKHGSYRSFKLHANNLKKFIKDCGTFEFEEVDWNLRLTLIDWLAKKNVQLGYGNKTLSVLRQFMERARRKKIHSNIKYQGSGWMVPNKKAVNQKVILSPKELKQLAELELSGFEEKVRDLFLIGAGTGQRFSDYSKYTADNFYKTMKGVPLLSVISQKTDTPAKIPLNIFPWLIPTLEKYNYNSPKMSMQKFNEAIKRICREAKFENKVLKVEQYMGRKSRVVKRYTPKFKEISSHTCRRSFATNLYRCGYKLSQIMPMTGHSTEVQLREYIGIDAEENAEQIGLAITKQSEENNQE
jgi:site-specific recombinase XerD